MKTIGMLGGMSHESTQEYYKIINEYVNEKLGKLHSAKILLHSVDFEETIDMEWEDLGKELGEIAKNLESIGAEVMIICTNTVHKVADQIQKNISIPLIHIADVTGENIKSKGLKKIGLLGTKFTMEEDFYKGRLKDNFELEVLVPDEEERQIVHDVIFKELCLGEIKEESKEKFKKIMENLISQGAEGIILGCTEIPLLVNEKDFEVPLFDTTRLHAEAAAKFALK